MRAVLEGVLALIVTYPADHWRPTVPALTAVIAYIRREPVRVATAVLVAVVVAVSLVTGTPIAAILGQVAALVASLESVRRVVAPMVKVVLLEDDLKADAAALGDDNVTGEPPAPAVEPAE